MDTSKLDKEDRKYVEKLEQRLRAVEQFQKMLERRATELKSGEMKMTYYSVAKELKKFLK